jgi:hypothetical protein
MCSPLKKVYDFDKNITTLRVKMVRRVGRTKKSPEDYQNQKLQET